MFTQDVWEKINELRNKGIVDASVPLTDGKIVQIKINQLGWYQGYY